MFLLTALSLLFTANPASADFKFVRPEADQASYAVGSKAILFAHIDHLPDASDSELSLSLLLNGEKMNVVQLSDRLAVAMPARFQLAGNLDFELRVSEQNKTSQMGFETLRASYLEQIDALQVQLREELDPEARALLQNRINLYQEKADEITARMESERTLLEIDHLALDVLPAIKNSIHPRMAFSGVADRNPAQYVIGEKATFTFNPNTEFNGPDGPKENIFSINLDSQPLGQAKKSGSMYQISTGVFSSVSLGAHILSASFSVRSQKQANALREANALAGKKIQGLIRMRDASRTDSDRAYYNYKINELNSVVSAISAQLSAILLPVATLNIPFTVTN